MVIAAGKPPICDWLTYTHRSISDGPAKGEHERASSISPYDEARGFCRRGAADADARPPVAVYLAIGTARPAAAGAVVAGAAGRRQTRHHRGAVHLQVCHGWPRAWGRRRR